MSEYHREPKAIAIGPYNANHSDLKKTDLKHRLAARFIRNRGKTGETLLPQFKKNFTADELKKLFKEKVIKGKDNCERKKKALIVNIILWKLHKLWLFEVLIPKYGFFLA